MTSLHSLWICALFLTSPNTWRVMSHESLHFHAYHSQSLYGFSPIQISSLLLPISHLWFLSHSRNTWPRFVLGPSFVSFSLRFYFTIFFKLDCSACRVCMCVNHCSPLWLNMLYVDVTFLALSPHLWAWCTHCTLLPLPTSAAHF